MNKPTNQKTIKQSTKKASMLSLFIELGDRGLNCFEAANRHHDYVLRSTVSELQKHYGLEFSRTHESVPNAFGKTTSCVRYWLDSFNASKAKLLLTNE